MRIMLITSLLALFACGDKDSDDTAVEESETAAEEAAEEETEEEQESEEE